MRFDPHYIPGEDAPLTASGEIDLPDDLLELASQLRDDAVYLAQKYPGDVVARSASDGRLVAAALVPASKDARPKSRSARIGLKHALTTAIGYVAAALLIAVGISYWNDSQSPDNAPLAATPMITSAPVATGDIIIDPPKVPGGDRWGRLPWAPRPAIGEVTGPELEGLLDLWQNDEKPAETRISI